MYAQSNTNTNQQSVHKSLSLLGATNAPIMLPDRFPIAIINERHNPMRTGNYMTQDRMIALSDSAGEILDWYKNLQRRIKIFLREGENGVSLDTMNELLLQDVPDFSAIETILAERAHFRNRGTANRRARDQMRLLRENRQDAAIEFSESAIVGQVKANQEYHEEEYIEETPVDLSTLDLNDPGTYEGFHRTLRENLGSGKFFYTSEICRTLLIRIDEVRPILLKMEEMKMLQEGSLSRWYVN